MTKLISVSDQVQDKLDELREPQGISYNEAILMLMEKPSMQLVWNRHMAVIGLMIRAFGKKDLDGELDAETLALAEAAKDLSKKALALGVI